MSRNSTWQRSVQVDLLQCVSTFAALPEEICEVLEGNFTFTFHLADLALAFREVFNALFEATLQVGGWHVENAANL